MLKSFFFIIIVNLFLMQNIFAQAKESEEVKLTLNKYLQAQARGNSDLIHQAFYKDARIMSVRDGKLANLSVDEFAKFLNSNPAKDEAKRKHSIKSIEIFGTAAIAKIVIDYPTIKFTDYMTLLKIDGEWKIVNKSFFSQPHNSKTDKSDSQSSPETTIRNFISSTKSGDSELLKKVLHPEGNQKYVEENKYSSKTYPEFLAQFERVRKGKPHPDDARRKRTIKSIEISGNVAIAKLIADFPDVRYFEYLALLKIGNEWQIVNNVFYGIPKPKQK